MTTAPARPTAARAADAAGRLLAVALVLAIYLAGDRPWPFAAVASLLALGIFACAIAWLALVRPSLPAMRFAWPRGLWLYVVYVIALVVVWAAHPGAVSSAELRSQGLFLAVVAGTSVLAWGRAGRAALVLHLGLLLLVLLQIGGPRSGIDHLGRAGFYHALEQWSGYPEIGLLMCVAAAAALALGLALSPRLARVGAVILFLAFAGATLLIQSRSATLTVAVVALWLVAVAAVRFRDRLAIAAAACVIAAGVWVAAFGPGPEPMLTRTSAAFEREAGIRRSGWDAAAAMALDHPVVGVGLGRYRAEYQARQLGADSSHAYNIVLHVLAEGGVIGFIGWLALWARACSISLRHSSRSAHGAALFATHAMLVAFLVRSQSEHFLANLETSFRMLLLVGSWIGLAEGLARREDEAGER